MFVVYSVVVYIIGANAQDSIVENVACQFDRMNITLDTNSPALNEVFPGRNQVKEATISINNKSDSLCRFKIDRLEDRTFSIPINPNQCAITVLNLEPQFTAVQARIRINAKGSNSSVHSLVYCLFSSIVSGTIGGDDPKPLTVNKSLVHGGVSGNKPAMSLNMQISTEDGEITTEAGLGEKLYFNVSVDPGVYAAIQPLSCFFSPFQEINNQTIALAFVENGCPLIQLRDLIAPMRWVNDINYSTSFKAFRFHSTNSLYIHCSVRLCVHKEDCLNECLNSTILDGGTPQDAQLRVLSRSRNGGFRGFRDKRQAGPQNQAVHASKKITILNPEEAHRKGKQSELVSSCVPRSALWLMVGCTGVISLLLLISCCVIIRLTTLRRPPPSINKISENSLHYGRPQPYFARM